MCIKMSDVRLSNASPTLERVDARLPDSIRPSVRRCLFGTPDREELRETYEEFMQAEERRFRDTYNFDPVEDRPLSGRYQWEVDEDAPEFYRRPPHGRLNRGRSSPRDQVETTPGQTAETERSRKRPSDPSGSSCSSEPHSKNSRSNGEREGDQPDHGTSRAAQVPEQAPEDQ